MVIEKRGFGVLCHISSLLSDCGIGTLGQESYEFVDFLAESGATYWQVLPLVQTGYGDSPYQSVCSYSGNPYFIDLKKYGIRGERCREVDYGKLYVERYAALRRAYEKFEGGEDFRDFVKEGRYHDYAVYQALKGKFGCGFGGWERKYRRRDASALARFERENEKEILFWQFLQFEFDRQWKNLKEYANGKGIALVGDLPLYTAYDSVDVWVNPELFKLNTRLQPSLVAGVPPDYFSKTGQNWGNPVYDWDKHREQNYEWWTERIRRDFERFDVVRIDHFRGFDRYYEIPSAYKTAKGGQWQDGPKEELFETLRAKLGNLSIIAEDLGIIDDGVRRLLKNTGFPGMKVLSFAFDGNPDNDYLPENIGENSVCYTGTHDNDTLMGYLSGLKKDEFSRVFERVKGAERELKGEKIPEKEGNPIELCADMIIESGFLCPSKLFVIPIQDAMKIKDGRMNVPSTASGNWKFRLPEPPSEALAGKLRRLAEISDRL